MRYLIYMSFILFLAAPEWSVAQQVNDTHSSEFMDIGNELVLEIIPAKYETVLDESRNPYSLEWIIIPVTFKTITKTKIVVPSHKDVEIVPPIYNSEGSILVFAKALIKEMPAITKQVSRRVVDKPSQVVQRKVPTLIKTETNRRLIKPKSYKIKDKSGVTLNHFENVESLAEYLNSR